uniref:Ig-like domain-containing protein n=1 Tax=Salarias fasciatus TaxID=181472 RepID=A0A672G0A5_SALFA
MGVFFMGTAHLLPLLALLSGISVVQQANIWVINTPTTVTAVEGSCVVVPCQTQPHYRVIWYQYHKINYPVVYDGLKPQTMEYQFSGRTSVPGDASEGNCSLLIANMKRNEHQLKVYAWINPDSGSKMFQIYFINLRLNLVLRNTPSISVQSQIVEGKTFQANCTINYSCPQSPPHIHWETSQFLENSTEKVFSGSQGGQWLLTETLRGVATYDMENSKMRCSAQFSSFTTHSQQITLNVLYEPANVTVVLEDEVMKEGGNVSANCAADSYPEADTYSWLQRHMGQISEINSTQRGITLYDVMRDTALSCTAINNVGAGQSDWLDLDVQCKKLILFSQHFLELIGSLTEQGGIIGVFKVLEGEFHPEKEYLYLTSADAPVILPESSCSQARDVLRCVCQAEASPTASLYWAIDGNYTLLSSVISYFTERKHLVRGEISMAGNSQTTISCTAWNPFGNDTKQISIEKSSNTCELSFCWFTSSNVGNAGSHEGTETKIKLS